MNLSLPEEHWGTYISQEKHVQSNSDGTERGTRCRNPAFFDRQGYTGTYPQDIPPGHTTQESVNQMNSLAKIRTVYTRYWFPNQWCKTRPKNTSVILESDKPEAAVRNSDLAKLRTRDERKIKLQEYVNVS